MSAARQFIICHGRRLLALMVIAVLYGGTRLPRLSPEQRGALADRFAFTREALPDLADHPGHPDHPDHPSRVVRDVHPSLARHAGWISVVGAAVAIEDLDHDGLPNDVAYVDPRIDRVVICPAPGTGARYEPFALDPSPLAYEPATTAPMGCLVGDLNEDGRNDLLAYYWGRTPIAFLRRDDGTPHAASYLAVETVRPPQRWYTNAATLADLDGDGHVDIVVGNYFPDDAGVLDAHGGDSSPQMNDSMSRAFNGGLDRVLRWTAATAGAEPSVSFLEVPEALPAESARGWSLAAGAADLDGDLLPELYFAHDFGPDRLLHNRSTPGQIRFAILDGRKTPGVPTSKVLGRDSFKGMGVDYGDVNGDGLLDIYVSNIADEFALEESHFLWESTGDIAAMQDGVAPYRDRSEPLGLSRSGWGWDSRLGDFDNDGVLEAVQATGFLKGDIDRWPELHELAMANDTVLRYAGAWPRFEVGDDLSGHQHNPFFVRSASGRYFDIAPDIGLGEPYMTRGVATADVDGDGDLDFAIANQWETSYLFRNEMRRDGAPGGAFLGLSVVLPVLPQAVTSVHVGHPAGAGVARAAIGATAHVRLPDGRVLVSEVDGGSGHSGACSHRLHFGLGDLPLNATVEVTLRWRDHLGRPGRQVVQLPAGWHTVVLGAGGTEGAAP